jgi:hypothetical protein
MPGVQLALSDIAWRDQLREELVRSGSGPVACVERPNPAGDEVLVVDAEHLDMLPRPIPSPERVVLVATREGCELAQAWEAGIRCVVYRKDPIGVTALAILSAALQAAKDRPGEP